MFKAIVPVILIIVSALVGYFYVLPIYDVTSSVKKEADVVKDSLQRIKEIGVASDKLRAEIETIPKEYKDSLNAALPEEIDQIRFLNMINTIAARRNLILTDPEITKPEQDSSPAQSSSADGIVNNKIKGTDIGKMSVSFSVSSSYEVFKEFMKDLEKSLALMDVNTVTLSGASGGSEEKVVGEEIYTYKVELTTYLLNSK